MTVSTNSHLSSAATCSSMAYILEALTALFLRSRDERMVRGETTKWSRATVSQESQTA